MTPSSILFRFNCSWFSDTNGAVRYFAVIVAESDGTNTEFQNFLFKNKSRTLVSAGDCLFTFLGRTDCLWRNKIYHLSSQTFHFSSSPMTATEMLQPEQRHPLPSHRDYISNSSVRAYQTSYFSSRCPQDADAATATAQVMTVTALTPGYKARVYEDV